MDHGAGVFENAVVGTEYGVHYSDLPRMDEQLCCVSDPMSSLGKILQACVVIELGIDAIDRRRKIELTAREHEVAAKLPDELGIVWPDGDDAEVDREIPGSDRE